ncbi:hypothetical protein ACFOYW_04700 [Gryllotalpicola reticulitermitis]|uniref:DUF7882 domain-containing protein n=1 Tax=Gryllotalpicola reticulitermitis TaxID=1184153 RepID=A0ABV8Q689_9MICO
MGVLHYGTRDFTLDDRLLAHLQVVIALKLRRSESFFLAWTDKPDTDGGRFVVWIDNGIPIFCEYEAAGIPSINRDWIDALAASAATNYGLQITPEGDVQPLPPVDVL